MAAFFGVDTGFLVAFFGVDTGFLVAFFGETFLEAFYGGPLLSLYELSVTTPLS